MKKAIYFIINGIALVIALMLLIFGSLVARILGLVGIVIVLKEFISGDYKKHIKDQLSEKEMKKENKKMKNMLLPFIIIGIIAIILFIVYAYQNWI